MTRTLIASLAIAAALALSPVAAAHMATAPMIGGVAISASDLPKVQAQCNALAAIAANETITSDASKERNEAETGHQATEPSAMDQATTTIDLGTITLEKCKAAGLLR